MWYTNHRIQQSINQSINHRSGEWLFFSLIFSQAYLTDTMISHISLCSTLILRNPSELPDQEPFHMSIMHQTECSFKTWCSHKVSNVTELCWFTSGSVETAVTTLFIFKFSRHPIPTTLEWFNLYTKNKKTNLGNPKGITTNSLPHTWR